jgi:FtsZ-binding cell division protein ZapB
VITLEQIRLLESKITRAIDLIRVLKDENGALRKGLESAQKRMKELESLVDGFKTDQHEIESVILRTLHTLDELEESASAGRKQERAAPPAGGTAGASGPAVSRQEAAAPVRAHRAPAAEAPGDGQAGAEPGDDAEPRTAKEELDIF